MDNDIEKYTAHKKEGNIHRKYYLFTYTNGKNDFNNILSHLINNISEGYLIDREIDV